MRSLVRAVDALVDTDSSAWPVIHDAVESSTRAVTLAVKHSAAEQCLYRLQVTTRSALGALAFHTGGIAVDEGWLRLLGGGHPPLPDLATANALGPPSDDTSPPPSLQVARDVLGGMFAINGGELPGAIGQVCYFGPDTLEWAPLDIGHGDFVWWAIGGGTEEFYADLRWQGWEREVAAIALNEGLSVYPPLFSRESQDRANTNRRAMPWEELVAFHADVRQQLGEVQPGQSFRLTVRDDE